MEVALTAAAEVVDGAGTAYFFKLSCRSLENVVCSRAKICAEFGLGMGTGMLGVVGEDDPLLAVVEDEGDGDGDIDGGEERKAAGMKE
jgi:hypothetical protein